MGLPLYSFDECLKDTTDILLLHYAPKLTASLPPLPKVWAQHVNDRRSRKWKDAAGTCPARDEHRRIPGCDAHLFGRRSTLGGDTVDPAPALPRTASHDQSRRISEREYSEARHNIVSAQGRFVFLMSSPNLERVSSK